MNKYDIPGLTVSEATPSPDTDVLPFLAGRLPDEADYFLLSYHDDGVIWGMMNRNSRRLSSGLIEESPDFRQATLQACRLFGPTFELLVWRDETGALAGRQLVETAVDANHSQERVELLHGEPQTYAFPEDRDATGFTLLVEGQQGLRHVLPLAEPWGEHAHLTIRDYISYDEHDQAFVAYSRLTGVAWAEMEKGNE